MNETPTVRSNGVQIERTYHPDLERQVRALLAVLIKKDGPAGQAGPSREGTPDAGARVPN